MTSQPNCNRTVALISATASRILGINEEINVNVGSQGSPIESFKTISGGQSAMRRFLLGISLIVALCTVALAQQASTSGAASAMNQTSVQKQGRQIDLQSGTQLAAQLENALDARHAKVGDRVALKTTQAIKQDGQVVVPKGAQLIGRVTDVQQQTKSTGESHIGLLLDRLRSGSTEIPITASIVSITQTRASTQNDNVGMESDTMTQTSASTRSSGGASRTGGGGLLGGVGNTVGGAVNATTSTVGNVTGTTTSAVGSTVGTTTSTAGNLTGSLRGLQISQSSSASAEGSSTLSLTGRNLRLESGTTFNLAVSNSTSAGGPQ